MPRPTNATRTVAIFGTVSSRASFCPAGLGGTTVCMGCTFCAFKLLKEHASMAMTMAANIPNRFITVCISTCLNSLSTVLTTLFAAFPFSFLCALLLLAATLLAFRATAVAVGKREVELFLLKVSLRHPYAYGVAQLVFVVVPTAYEAEVTLVEVVIVVV